MSDNAAATDTLFTQRIGAVATMSAPDNMHSYAQIARAYADNTEASRPLSTAFMRASRTPKSRPPTRCSVSRRPLPASPALAADRATVGGAAPQGSDSAGEFTAVAEGADAQLLQVLCTLPYTVILLARGITPSEF
jgi:hypothetical protein